MRTIGVKLTADTTGYMSGLARASAATKDFTGHMDTASKAGKFDKVADSALKVGLVGAAAFGMVVKSAADFDKEMSAAGAATNATSAQMGKLRAAALQAGKDTQYSATQAANGITELGKAGVSTADILHGGLKGALSLAAAGQLSVGDAAETAASAMTQFKLSGTAVPHIADLLAEAANKAQGSVGDLGYALKMSGLVASQTGHSIEETTGVLAAFASAGLIGSDAGTSLKEMLLKLMSPAEATQKVMGNLGIEVYDAQGNMKSFAGIADELRKSMAGLTQQQRDADMAKIFGSDAIRAATILYREGSAGINDWTNKVNVAGAAATTSAKLMDNLSGDLELLKGSWETLAIQAGSGPNSGLRLMVQALNAVVNQVLAMPPAVTSTITVLVGLGGALLLGGVAWGKYRKAVAEAEAQLIAMGPAGEKAAAGISKATALIGKIGLWAIAFEAAGAGLNALGQGAADVDKLTASLTNLANTGKSSGELNTVFGENAKNFQDVAFMADFSSKGVGKFLEQLETKAWVVGDFTGALYHMGQQLNFGTDSKNAAADMTALDAALTNTMSTLNDAGKASALWNQVLQQSGEDTSKLAEQLPNAYKKVGELNAAADKTSLSKFASGANKAAAGVHGVGVEATMSAADLKKLSDAIDQAITGHLSLDRATIAYKQGLVDLRKELTSGARSLSVNTVEGRKNRGAVLDQISSINELRKSRIAEGTTIDKASALYLKDIDGLRKSMRQAGFSKTAVDQLIGSYKNIPGHVDTKVSITGAGPVKAEMNRLMAYQQALKKGTILPGFQGPVRDPATGKYYAEGGWTGRGSKYEPAGIVHADEFVIRKESRQRIEAKAPGLLDNMNRTGRVPGYAQGGRAVWPYPVNASGTKVPSAKEAAAAIIPAGPTGGGMTYKWIEAVVRQAFPGMQAISDYRPGAVTLTGNRSYHADGRAVDFPPSLPLAEWINLHYMARTKELITPWQNLNIRNGARHQYSALVENEHNFAGGNAHDHWAMAHGGVIGEPVVGVGRSGATYSFAENGPETVLPGLLDMGGGHGHRHTSSPTINLYVELAAGANMAEAGRQIGQQLSAYLKTGGSVVVRGKTVLSAS